ncbi:LmeA family phospholipid-binding protein [Corynebacterium guangdongense]|uniref:DUF2993 domain-containing protein n=1 Tax=Corynebacterium guangdongense TaxID=1783348 RepID=A0ABU2A1I5_9CORY|nr:DUF2993 domain-containing protein [Corynebacterium guangdongense]MDR7330875.1 hypothetical protein [Corynebacterium guangdongense]WJZ16890.1 hypothetical protein CGUA_01450 [Corynebacterium guangdongense]
MAKTSSGSTLWRVLLAILTVLVVLLIAAEVGLRMYLSGQVTQGFEQQAQEDGVVVTEEPEVSFGASPLVFGLLGGTLPQVTMRTPSTLQQEGETYKGTPAADVRIEDLTVAENPVAGTLTTTTELPEDYMLAIIREQLRSQVGQDSGMASTLVDELGITDLNANVAEQTLDLEFARGLAGISLAPADVDGQMSLEARSTRLFGMELPQEVSASISQALQEGIAEQANEHAGADVANSLTIDSYEIVDGALRVTVTGHDVPLSEL